jgi:hypothetical protein
VAADQHAGAETRRGVTLQLRADVHTGKARHEDVQQDHIRPFVVGNAKRVGPVGGRPYRVVAPLQQIAQAAQGRIVVVRDQHGACL